MTKSTSQSRPIIGCFPLYPPLALFHSMGMTPIVLWGLRNTIISTRESDKHIQNYACSVVRHLTEFVLSEKGKVLDAIFMYNACDSLRNLPEILFNGLKDAGRPIPVFNIHLPMVLSGRTDSPDFLKNELSALVRRVETEFSLSFSEDNFFSSVSKYEKIRGLCRQLDEKTAAGQLSFADFVELMDKSWFCAIDSQISIFENTLKNAGLKKASIPEKPVVLSGILPPPKSILKAITAAGLRVTGNDLAYMGRSYKNKTTPIKNPYKYYFDFYQNHYPCPTLLYTADLRIALLEELIERNKAKGVIFIGEKFCEYEYFEFPHLARQLKNNGINSLLLEISADDEAMSGLETRIGAFSELISQQA